MEDFKQKSFWLEGGTYKPNPPLSEDIDVDVAIIGGGFTGLSAAYHLKKFDSGLRVVVLESEVVGYGASGRNAGFAMTLFGLTMSITALRFGKEKTAQAHFYMEKAVDYVTEMVQQHHLDCDYERPGFFRVAVIPAYEKRIKHEIELAHSLGITGIEWIDRDKLYAEVNSPLYLGAWWEPRCVLVNPAKLCRELKRLAVSYGADVYENTPVGQIKRNSKFELSTPKFKVSAKKIVFATNAWSILIPELKNKQVPAWTYIILTEPLDKKTLATIGWKNRQGIEDPRNLVHYYRLTADNRVLMGGANIAVGYGKNMDYDQNEKIFEELQRDLVALFPGLKDTKITHRWGGPVSVPMDMAPAIGYVGKDRNAVYSLGCVGHGVSTTHLNGWTIADMLFEKKTERTDVFFVNRKTIPWPPEPFRFIANQAIRGYMRAEDGWKERKLKDGESIA